MPNKEFIDFIKNNQKNRLTINNESTLGFIREFTIESVKAYSPETILLIGSDTGLALVLSSLVQRIYLIIEDTSFADPAENNLPKNIYFICGRATDMPVDYHSVDMAICADYLDLYDSSRLMDELKRSLEFEGLLLIAGRVCSNDDLDGIYDELYRMINPFHNDYYLISDLKTFLSLKEILPVNERINTFTTDLSDFFKKMDAITGENRTERAFNYLQENSTGFSRLYELQDSTIKEIFYTGLFRCKKPEFEEYEEELRRVKKMSGIIE